MNPPIWSQLGVGGVLAIVIIRDILKFLQDKKTANEVNETTKKLDSIMLMMKDLYKWHSKEDGDGIKLWYNNVLVKEVNKLIGVVEMLQKDHHEVIKTLAEKKG